LDEKISPEFFHPSGPVSVAPNTPDQTNSFGDDERSRMAETRDLNFKVPLEFHRQFKITASLLEISMNELLIRCFDYFLDHPDRKSIRKFLKSIRTKKDH
jgi:hypothetical protein